MYSRIRIGTLFPLPFGERDRVRGSTLWTLLFVSLAISIAEAKVYLTQQQALELAFGRGVDIQRETLFLEEGQVEKIERLAGSRLESRVVVYYVGMERSEPVGYAFFVTDTVRTMPAVMMVVLNPNATVRFVEMLAFYEPEDYRPHPRWLKLFEKRPLEDNLVLHRDIPNMTGATLTARTVTNAVRRSLAILQVAVLGVK